MTRLLAGWLIIFGFSLATATVAMAGYKDQMKQLFDNDPPASGGVSGQMESLFADDISKDEAVKLGRNQENTSFGKSRMNQMLSPLTGGGELRTLDGQTAFAVSGIACPGAQDYLRASVVPSTTTGDIQLIIRQDTNFDGTQNYFWQAPHQISGVCANGYISCNPGTWQNCTAYQWHIGSDNRVASTVAASDDLYGCFCFNASCGTNLAWMNLNNILTQVGTGISTALQGYNPHLVITGAQIQNTNEIVYQAQDAANCSDVSGSSGAQYFSKVSAHDLETAGSAAYINPGSDTIGTIVQASATDMNVESRQCKIIRTINIDHDTTVWQNNRQCPEPSIVDSWTAGALQHQCDTSRYLNTDLTFSQTDMSYGGPVGFEIRLNGDDVEIRELASSITGPWRSLMNSTHYIEQGSSHGKVGGTCTSGCTRRLRYGFETQPGKIRLRARCQRIDCGDGTGEWIDFSQPGPQASNILTLHIETRPCICMEWNSTEGYCSQWESHNCYWDYESGEHLIDDYYPVPHWSLELNEDGTHLRMVHHSRNSTGPWIDITVGCRVNCKKDVFSESVSNTCTHLSGDPACQLRAETVDTVNTISNFNPTQISAIPSSKVFAGGLGNYAYTRPYWEVSREYHCIVDGDDEFEFDAALQRYISVTDSVDLDSSGKATFSDRRITSSGFSVDSYALQLGNFGEIEPEYYCKTRRWIEEPKASVQTNETIIREDIGTWKYGYYICESPETGHHVCPAAADEEIVQDCTIADDFAEAAAAMETLDAVRADMICSDGVKK